jgi:hypothetical protein
VGRVESVISQKRFPIIMILLLRYDSFSIEKKQFHESMTQYYFGKMNLLQACNITGKHAVFLSH